MHLHCAGNRERFKENKSFHIEGMIFEGATQIHPPLLCALFLG